MCGGKRRDRERGDPHCDARPSRAPWRFLILACVQLCQAYLHCYPSTERSNDPLLMRTVAALAIAVLLPLAAEAQVLDTLETASDSTDYAVETYFVKVDSASFFKPHSGEEAVRSLLNRTGRGRCRVVTVVRAVDQRRAGELVRRYDGAVINTRLIVRCAPPRPTRSVVRPSTLVPKGRELHPSLRPTQTKNPQPRVVQRVIGFIWQELIELPPRILPFKGSNAGLQTHS